MRDKSNLEHKVSSTPAIENCKGPSIKDVRTLGGGWGSGKSGQIRTEGGGWLAKCGRSLEKKAKYLANHACVSHLLRGQPHLLECYYRNCLIGAHMCVHLVSE